MDDVIGAILANVPGATHERPYGTDTIYAPCGGVGVELFEEPPPSSEFQRTTRGCQRIGVIRFAGYDTVRPLALVRGFDAIGMAINHLLGE